MLIIDAVHRALARLPIMIAAGLLASLAIVVLAPFAAAQDDERVAITSKLEPVQLEIEPGTTVTWSNDDDERHRVRSRDGPLPFDSGNLEPGESFSLTFTVEGSYPYSDHRHRDDPAYFGTIVVGGPRDPGDGPPPKSGAISIIDRSFRPPSFTLATGGTIEWSNDDGEAHTVTSSDSAFDSGILDGGTTFSQTFDEAGTFAYFCLIHPEMRGTITVADPTPEPGTETPADPPLGSPDGSVVPDPGASVVPDPGASVVPDPGARVSPGASVVPEASVVPGASVVPDPGASVSPDPGASVVPGAEAVVSIIDRSFQPIRIELGVGDAVLWANDDDEGHTVTAVEGDFNSGVLTVGDEFSTAFTTPGSYDYFCAIHPQMTGTVIVAEPAG